MAAEISPHQTHLTSQRNYV